MTTVFVIDDTSHSDWIGRFASRDDAVAELRRLAEVPWDEEPNRAPCTTWAKCGRTYDLVEFEVASQPPWHERSRVFALAVSAAGVRRGEVLGRSEEP